jgi:hypothetical protein
LRFESELKLSVTVNEPGVVQIANDELEEITPQLRAHPDVLELRWQIYAAAKKWEPCVDIAAAITKLAPDRPSGWIHPPTPCTNSSAPPKPAMPCCPWKLVSSTTPPRATPSPVTPPSSATCRQRTFG